MGSFIRHGINVCLVIHWRRKNITVISIFVISSYLLIIVKFTFELKGEFENEQVKIFRLGSGGRQLVTSHLTKEWQEFSFSSMSGVRIFHVWRKNNSTVYLRYPEQYNIKIEGKGDWFCGTSREYGSCKSLRAGKFLWNGNYMVTNQGISYWCHKRVNHLLLLLFM